MPTYRFEFPDDPSSATVTLDLPNDDAAEKEALRATAEAMMDNLARGDHSHTCVTKVFNAATNVLVAQYRLPTAS